ncbi:MAG: ABC transporter ATP-binding protein [Arcobacteraceae bacterium]|jgi:ABC-type polysaccharide/polyol phosphate transport system ATPase subunit|nr:ABC transporter ATP-binding protein [Arcobacteraceae bacterium]
MPNTAIKVSHLTKVYKLYDKPIDRLKESLNPLKKKYHKDFYALSDVDFEIKKGETVGIIGKNGAGKSTLLKIITGVQTPTSGHVHVNGRIASLLELGAGFNPEYTGIENIYLQGTLMGYNHQEMEMKIDEILRFADIGDFVHQPVKMYSSGMFARLAFAVAINVDPDVLIVDEVLSVGDAAFQRKCFSRMETIRNNGTTIIFVSHSEGQIVELCNRAIFVHAGQIVLDGEPKRVTGLYSKMMNSGIVDVEAIVEEFNNPKKNDASLAKKNIISELQNNEEDDFEEYYDNTIVSQSQIHYESDGAKIKNIRLTCINKENIINTIQFSKLYEYKYDVYFEKDVTNVRFGMMIKSLSGIGLSGSTYPAENKEPLNFKESEKITVAWSFKNYYNDGVYLCNAGVHGMLSNNSIGFLDRIHDVLSFKSVSKKTNLEIGLYLNPKISINIVKHSNE